MVDMSSVTGWALADALKISLKWDGTRFQGEGKNSVDFGGLLLDIPLQVKSTILCQDGVGVLLQSIGNVAMFAATPKHTNVDVVLYILDLALLKGNLQGWFADKHPGKLADAVAMLEHATVKIFTQRTKRWKEVGDKRGPDHMDGGGS